MSQPFWNGWQQRLDAMTLRERALVLVVAAVLVVALLQLLLVDPALEARTALKRQASSLQAQIETQRSERAALETLLASGVQKNLRQQRRELEAGIAVLREDLQQTVVGMIPPHRMAEVLERVLSQDAGLKLLRVENRSVVPLLEREGEVDDSQGLYRHGFTLELEGSFPAAMRYFEKLAELPWRFYWDSLHYRVQDYPAAKITLDVYTVSLTEEWISV